MAPSWASLVSPQENDSHKDWWLYRFLVQLGLIKQLLIANWLFYVQPLSTFFRWNRQSGNALFLNSLATRPRLLRYSVRLTGIGVGAIDPGAQSVLPRYVVPERPFVILRFAKWHRTTIIWLAIINSEISRTSPGSKQGVIIVRRPVLRKYYYENPDR